MARRFVSGTKVRIPYTGWEVSLSRGNAAEAVVASSGLVVVGSPVRAAAPNLPAANDVAMTNVLPPFGTNPPAAPIMQGDVDLGDRSIYSDPRELWYLCLPNKLTPQQVLQILRSALAGDIWQQWQLCSLMLDTWPTFRKAAHELMEGAAYMRYVVHAFAEEGGKPSEKAKKKADVVSRAIAGMAPNPFNDEKGFSGMCYSLCDALLNGLSMTELMWETKRTAKGLMRLPRSSAWIHPRHYTFTNDGYIAVFDSTYGRLMTPTQSAPKAYVPDERKFMCAQFMSRAGSSLGAGFMRPLAWAWAARQFNLEWMLNTAKQYGAPFIDITYKPGAVTTDPGDNSSDIAKLTAMLKTAGANRRLIHPEGTVAEIHPAHPLGKENPQRVLEEKADEWCLYLLLGQKGTTFSTPGQLGNQEAHADVKNERVLGVANWLARNPLRQFARAVVKCNFGDDDECPVIMPDTTKPLEAGEVGQLMTSVSGSRIPVRADELYKKLGFSQPEPGETVVAGGKMMEMGEVLNEEEMFAQDLERQQAQGQQQVALEQQAAGVRASLRRMSNAQLDKLEDLIRAAERAPHPNGELETLRGALAKGTRL